MYYVKKHISKINFLFSFYEKENLQILLNSNTFLEDTSDRDFIIY